MIEARYDYLDTKGTPRLRKLRWRGKRFVMRSAVQQDHKGVWRYRNGVTDEQFGFWTRALYRLPELVAALRVDATVWWCEGEKDADALAGFGLVATTTPNPSELWDDQARWFTKFRTQSEVMVVCDVDHHGGWWGWERYSRLLRVGVAPERVHVLAPPRGFKDVTELIEAGHRPSDLRSVDLGRLRAVADRYGAMRASRYTRRRGGPTPEEAEGLDTWRSRVEVVVPRRAATPVAEPGSR